MRALVVEDEDAIRELIRLKLSDHGIESFEARSVVEARELFAAHRNEISVIFVDGSVLDGLTDNLVRDLRRGGFGGPMVAISGSINQTLIEAGCSHALAKPLELVEKLNKLLTALFPLSVS